jgi:hypothetical protein
MIYRQISRFTGGPMSVLIIIAAHALLLVGGVQIVRVLQPQQR